MLRRSFVFSGLAAAASAVTGCSRRKTTARRQVQVGLTPYLSMSPFHVAKESGYFSREGLDIEPSQFTEALQTVPLLAAGKLDVGFIANSPSLINSIAQGARVRIVAAREAATPCSNAGRIFVSRKRFPNGVQELHQLKGKTFTVVSFTSRFMLDVLLEHYGMRREDVRTERMNNQEGLAALQAGGVDAVIASSTDLTQAAAFAQLAPGPSFTAILPGFQFSFIVFGRRLLEGDPESGRSFLRAYFQGLGDFLHGKTPRFMRQYADANHLDPHVVETQCRNTMSADGAIRTADLDRFIHWCVANKYSPKIIEPASLIDARFLGPAKGDNS